MGCSLPPFRRNRCLLYTFLYIVIIPITIKIGIKIFFTIQLYMEIFFCEKSKFIIAIQQT